MSPSTLTLGLLVLISIADELHAGDAVPVLLWGGVPSQQGAIDPFVKTSRNEFQSTLEGKIGASQPPIVVFVKDNLCVEDITKHREKLGDLRKVDPVTYLPAVDSPLSVFSSLSSYNVSIEDEVESVFDGQLIVTSVTDLDRVSDSFKTIKESSPNLIGALTGRSCAYTKMERVRRAAVDPAADGTTPAANAIITNTSRILFYVEEALLRPGTNDSVINITTVTATENIKGSTINLLLTFTPQGQNFDKIVLRFPFAISLSGYISLKNVSCEINGNSNATILIPNVEIVFPTQFSYHCTQKIVFKSSDMQLNLTWFQVQVDPKNGQFSDTYDCVGFTTVPIWTGIFVTAILAIIMIWALTMIIDIRTMDRFDDAKGKTITINAQE